MLPRMSKNGQPGSHMLNLIQVHQYAAGAPRDIVQQRNAKGRVSTAADDNAPVMISIFVTFIQLG